MSRKEDIQEGINELYDGSKELSDGLSELDENGGKMTDGAGEIFSQYLAQANSTLLSMGVTETLTAETYAEILDKYIAAANSSELSALKNTLDGLKGYSDRVTEYTKVVHEAAEGAAELSDGVKELKNQTDDMLDELFTVDISYRVVEASENPRIAAAAADMQMKRIIGLIAGIIIMVLFTYVNVSHEWMMKFLEHDIADKNFLRYVKRFLIAGVMEGSERKESDKGTPQGGQISPIPANVYLHYVLDLWYEKIIRRQYKGEVYYVRYADDFLMMFQYENEAWRVMEALKKRLEKFSLEVAEDKTCILPIGRFKGAKEDFDFLGFTFFNTQTREGKYRLGVHTSKKKMKAKKQAVKKWLHDNMHKPIGDTMKQIQKPCKVISTTMALAEISNRYASSGNMSNIAATRC